MPVRTHTFAQVRQALLAKREIALIDVREEDAFAQAHPLFAANLPLRCISETVRQRIPRPDTTIVLYDDGEGLALQAAQALQKLGYLEVKLLEGGLDGWRAAGGEIFKDVNVPSKAFGEFVESVRHTPSLSALEVKALLDNEASVVVLDVRRFDEYQTMSIPTGISVPGAELVLRAAALAPDPATRIIVNCAGRTRSIIGTQSLVNAGIANPVSALRNGTIGWKLAGQSLIQGASRCFLAAPDAQQAIACIQARSVADRAAVRRATQTDLTRFLAETTRTTYCFDVRTPDEFLAGHLSGFYSAPGGQLVQETDVSMPVRGARVVLADLEGVRANMTASWLAQMGWEVWVLDGLQVVDLSESGHMMEIAQSSMHRYRRPYEGTDNPVEAMQAYLDWEYGLVEQLARDGTHGFQVI
jgi:rhodanese-related sulfurtransferase